MTPCSTLTGTVMTLAALSAAAKLGCLFALGDSRDDDEDDEKEEEEDEEAVGRENDTADDGRWAIAAAAAGMRAPRRASRSFSRCASIRRDSLASAATEQSLLRPAVLGPPAAAAEAAARPLPPVCSS
jgi:hypothetical protein